MSRAIELPLEVTGLPLVGRTAQRGLDSLTRPDVPQLQRSQPNATPTVREIIEERMATQGTSRNDLRQDKVTGLRIQ